MGFRTLGIKQAWPSPLEPAKQPPREDHGASKKNKRCPPRSRPTGCKDVETTKIPTPYTARKAENTTSPRTTGLSNNRAPSPRMASPSVFSLGIVGSTAECSERRRRAGSPERANRCSIHAPGRVEPQGAEPPQVEPRDSGRWLLGVHRLGNGRLRRKVRHGHGAGLC